METARCERKQNSRVEGLMEPEKSKKNSPFVGAKEKRKGRVNKLNVQDGEAHEVGRTRKNGVFD